MIEVFSIGFLHSDTPGSKSLSDSPRLFAGWRVLLRLSMPRHSPIALSNLITFLNYRFKHRLTYMLIYSLILYLLTYLYVCQDNNTYYM